MNESDCASPFADSSSKTKFQECIRGFLRAKPHGRMHFAVYRPTIFAVQQPILFNSRYLVSCCKQSYKMLESAVCGTCTLFTDSRRRSRRREFTCYTVESKQSHSIAIAPVHGDSDDAYWRSGGSGSSSPADLDLRSK